ncbi:MAG: GAF domain-containing protein [Anaerocolumna sp.]
MEQKVLEDLFQEMKEVTKLDDIGYHRIEDGRLKPVYKTQTDVLGIEKWKTVHGQNPVYIKDTYILQEVKNKKQPVYIYDTNNDSRSADAFFLFGVDSILIVPVIRQDEVKAIICIVSIGSLHNFTTDEIEKCTLLSAQYLKDSY